MITFSGKNVVITGAASGIGRRLSEMFEDAGSRVFALDIDESGLSTLAKTRSNRFFPVPCDLSSERSIVEAFQKVSLALQQSDSPTGNGSSSIDILINNAGIVYSGQIEDHTSDEIERTFAINVISHFYTLQAVLPEMKRNNSGHIVTIASAASFVGTPKLSAYSASKFALIGLEDSLRGEIKASGKQIRTTLVAPYFVNTGMFDGVRTRFSWLLPILDLEYVCKRIFKAIQKGKKRLIMPRFVYTVFPLRLHPVSQFDWLAEFFGITRSMTHFKGRPRE